MYFNNRISKQKHKVISVGDTVTGKVRKLIVHYLATAHHFKMPLLINLCREK